VDDVLLAPDDRTDETGAGVLDDEVLLGLDLGNRLLHGARMDEVVVRRTGRHSYMLSTARRRTAEDAPGAICDTPGLPRCRGA
jgi:hypothetical protein